MFNIDLKIIAVTNSGDVPRKRLEKGGSFVFSIKTQLLCSKQLNKN